jgi:SAM-dependent methyltransferase
MLPARDREGAPLDDFYLSRCAHVTDHACRRSPDESAEPTAESRVRRHYEELLAPIYSWTLGDFDARVEASRQLFSSLLVTVAVPDKRQPGPRRGLDLGCGTGVQTLALAALGYGVTGVDFSARILGEYAWRTRAAGASAIEADISRFDAGNGYDVAVCLGDTVSHLQDWDAVRAMFRCVSAALGEGGAFILASRDHSKVYRGDDRFLLIRADASQSLTCFLEDEGEHVRVTDIVHYRMEEGSSMTSRTGTQVSQRMTVGSYLKLRVSPSALAAELERAGLEVRDQREAAGGVHVLLAVKGAS